MSSWLFASEQEPHPGIPLQLCKVLFCSPLRGHDPEAAPAVLAVPGRTTTHTLFNRAGFEDVSVSEKRLNTTGKLHRAITKAGCCNKPGFWVINSLLSGLIQMQSRYTALPFILLNPNLTMRFPFAVHFRRHFGAISPTSCMFVGFFVYTMYVLWEPHVGAASPQVGVSAKGCAQMLQPARGTNTVRIPRSATVQTAWQCQAGIFHPKQWNYKEGSRNPRLLNFYKPVAFHEEKNNRRWQNWKSG